MENKNIIIILVVAIVIIAAAVGVALLNPTSAKEPSKIKITSDKEQCGDGALSIKLTDINGTPISKEIVNITVTSSKGKVVVDDVVKTDSKGKASLDFNLNEGKYDVNVTYGGNDNYTGNSKSQKLTIKEEVVEATHVSDTSVQSGSNTHIVMGEDGYYARIDDNGNILENLGPSKKYYPNDPNAVDYPDAESMGKYIDKSQG